MIKKITKWFNKHKPFIKNVCILIAFGRLVYNEPELAYKLIECATGYAILQFPNFENITEKYDV